MKTFFLQSTLKIIVLSLLCIAYVKSAASQEMKHYKLGPDDVISVTVFDEPDLSLKEVRISSTGAISLPLVGQLIVKDMSVIEAENLIYEAYKDDYLKKPDVSITIVEYRQFYVSGEVEKPGGYSYREGMTVQRAITLAGGFTERASKTSIEVIRENGDGKPVSATLNTPVNPGDVVTVEESFF